MNSHPPPSQPRRFSSTHRPTASHSIGTTRVAAEVNGSRASDAAASNATANSNQSPSLTTIDDAHLDPMTLGCSSFFSSDFRAHPHLLPLLPLFAQTRITVRKMQSLGGGGSVWQRSASMNHAAAAAAAATSASAASIAASSTAATSAPSSTFYQLESRHPTSKLAQLYLAHSILASVTDERNPELLRSFEKSTNLVFDLTYFMSLLDHAITIREACDYYVSFEKTFRAIHETHPLKGEQPHRRFEYDRILVCIMYIYFSCEVHLDIHEVRDEYVNEQWRESQKQQQQQQQQDDSKGTFDSKKNLNGKRPRNDQADEIAEFQAALCRKSDKPELQHFPLRGYTFFKTLLEPLIVRVRKQVEAAIAEEAEREKRNKEEMEEKMRDDKESKSYSSFAAASSSSSSSSLNKLLNLLNSTIRFCHIQLNDTAPQGLRLSNDEYQTCLHIIRESMEEIMKRWPKQQQWRMQVQLKMDQESMDTIASSSVSSSTNFSFSNLNSSRQFELLSSTASTSLLADAPLSPLRVPLIARSLLASSEDEIMTASPPTYESVILPPSATSVAPTTKAEMTGTASSSSAPLIAQVLPDANGVIIILSGDSDEEDDTEPAEEKKSQENHRSHDKDDIEMKDACQWHLRSSIMHERKESIHPPIKIPSNSPQNLTDSPLTASASSASTTSSAFELTQPMEEQNDRKQSTSSQKVTPPTPTRRVFPHKLLVAAVSTTTTIPVSASQSPLRPVPRSVLNEEVSSIFSTPTKSQSEATIPSATSASTSQIKSRAKLPKWTCHGCRYANAAENIECVGCDLVRASSSLIQASPSSHSSISHDA